MVIHSNICPCCGYCPSCGRTNSYPWVSPWRHVSPYWTHTVIVNTTNQTAVNKLAGAA